MKDDISLACAAQSGGMLCHIIAGLYYIGVKELGDDAFEAAQAQAGAK